MSNLVQNVFHEYTRLRLNGLETTEAVRALHPHLTLFDADMRDNLAQFMRAWENQRTERTIPIDRQKLAAAAANRMATEAIKCPNCGKSNSAKEAICYSCGTLLSPVPSSATAILPLKTDEHKVINEAQFSMTSTLYLIPSDGNTPYILRPQMGTSRLTIGRGTGIEEAADVDVDLERLGASKQGVSRLHATIAYDEVSETLSLIDLGSTNGTFLNGQRLQPNERRSIRHGDQLSFGRLQFKIVYKLDDV